MSIILYVLRESSLFMCTCIVYRDFTRPDLPAGDPSDQATIPDLSAYGEGHL